MEIKFITGKLNSKMYIATINEHIKLTCISQRDNVANKQQYDTFQTNKFVFWNSWLKLHA